MAKKKKVKSSPQKQEHPERSAAVWRGILYVFTAMCIVGIGGIGFRYLYAYVQRQVSAADQPPRVVIVNRPAWMSDFLADQIATTARPIGVHSAFDRQMLAEIEKSLTSDLRTRAWIKKVRQLRRVYGNAPGDTIELDCEFRTPIALVQYGKDFLLVDTEGVLLPDHFSEAQIPQIIYGREGVKEGHPNIRVIRGVQMRPPVSGGQLWRGDDLQAGLELVKLLYGKAYCDEILTVDVSNFGGRNNAREAQIVLFTRYLTQINWGLPISAANSFAEASAGQKLGYLREIYAQYGRVDAGKSQIDIRMDHVTTPTDPQTPQAAARP